MDEDPLVLAMEGRIRNVLVTLNTYRMKHADNKSVEEIMDQLELIRDRMMSKTHLTLDERESLHFNSVAGTPLEDDDALVTELQSIRSFAAHSL